MTFGDALRLGRVSNLPTVWTNVLAGVALGGATPSWGTGWTMLALSLFYVGGMYLNDAFDHEIDAQERPERPIPSGRVGVRTVMSAGLMMLAAGIGGLAWLGGAKAALAGLGLAAAITYYNADHKGNRFGPVVMGLCRAFIYPCAAFTVASHLPTEVLIGAALLWAYVIALTYVAKQPGTSGKVVVWLIACISLVDVTILAFLGLPQLALLAVATIPLTRLLQHYVPAN